MTLVGIDISKWQQGLDLSKVKCDFVIIKSTEGIGYVDPMCDTFFQQAKKLGKKIGFYHFARPANNPIEEAQWFYKQTKNYFGVAVPCLDWEYKPVSNVQWAEKWLDEVYRLSGIKPMIYMNENTLNSYNWQSVANKSYGLWVAKYRDNKPDYNYDMANAGSDPKIKWWKSCAMWQWTSTGRLNGYSGNLDCDIFYGTREAWDRYVGKVKEPKKTPQTFYAEYVGRVIDDDGAYGAQCVDGFRVGCKYLGIPAVITPSNYADGYWTCKNMNGTINASTKAWVDKWFIRISDWRNFQNGDWVIWAKGSKSHPSSHIAMWYLGKEFGENQGGNRGFCLKSTDFTDALGALRPKVWATSEPVKTDDLSKYTNEELANMTIAGFFGNGEDRKKALGNRYANVQAIVDRILQADKYRPNLPFTQSNTNNLVNAHRYDFDYKTFAEYMKKCGGYQAYVRSLGGVFTKWNARNTKPTPDYQAKTVREFQEAADYVFGLMTMYGFNYNHGKPYSNKNWGKGADDAFYPASADYDKLGLYIYENGHKVTIDEICSGSTKGGMQTNCGWSATYIFHKAGLIPADGENMEVEFYGDKDYHKYYRKRGAELLSPKNTSDLKVGDVIGFFKSGTGFTYAHCATVVKVDKKAGTYTLFDGGSSRFVKTRGCNVVGKLGDSPLYGSYVSWKVLRLKETKNLLDLKYDPAKTGAYKVTCNDFNMRSKPSTDSSILCKLKKDTIFTTDGDYEVDKQGRVWLYGTAKSGSVSYKGFCCAKTYLKKV